jgi:hypothetical protein
MPGLLGAHAQSAIEQSDLFCFFHLQPVPSLLDTTARKIGFKPSGESFHALTTVYCFVDQSDHIRSLELQLRRSFIDDPTNGIFAADMAKSFIYNAAGRDISSDLRALAEDIEFRATSRQPIISGPINRGAAALQRSPTAAYQVYLGRSSNRTLISGPIRAELENLLIEGENVFSLRISKTKVTWFKKLGGLFSR